MDVADITVSKINEVYFYIDSTDDIALDLKEYVSFKTAQYWFHPKYKMGIWDGKISLFNVSDRTLPIGLLKRFLTFCHEYSYTYSLDFDIDQLIDVNITANKVLDISDRFLAPCAQKITIRDDQVKAIYKCLYYKRGCVVSPTGSGKSLIIYIIIRYILSQPLESNILLVVPNIGLVNQMFSDFKDYGWSDCENIVGILYAGKIFNVDKKVLISTWQSIHNRKKAFFKKFNTLIIDECHLAKGNSITKIAQNCTSACYRLGFTGTMPTIESDVYNIFGSLGPCIYNKLSHELICDGILSQITIANIIIKYPQDVILLNKNRPYVEEVRTIETNKMRNKVFNVIFNKFIPDGENTLILVKHVEHLKNIEQHLTMALSDKYTIYIVYQDIKPDIREKMRKKIENSSNAIIIGTYATMSTGINIKKLHNVIFAASYKSKIKVLQSIGRGLRLHITKAQLILWDLIDDLSWMSKKGKIHENHMYKHFLIRSSYYKEQHYRCVGKIINLIEI